MRLAKWRTKPLCLLLVGVVCQPSCSLVSASRRLWTATRKQDALNRTRELWYHGYDNYMLHAFPADELRPLSCTGRGPDWLNSDNYGNNDVAANVTLTLIDVLDTFFVLRDYHGFQFAVRNVIENVSFDVDTKPQVFEITIRVLGGLLSGHIIASDSASSFHLPWYRGELLALAHDLGERLLPAFRTATGIPYARTNLRYGVPKGESIESCTAGAGSLILEFGTLSRLTDDDRFERAAHKAFFALWNRRSDINLVGNTVNIWTGAWTPPMVASIGAGIDSFYEYALKWYVMTGEIEFLDVFQEAYSAIMRYTRTSDGFWYHSVWMHTGEVAYATVDSLSCFWPGLQVLAGDVENAIQSHLTYWNLWKRHSGMPEVFDINFSKSVSHQYPLRPEFIESTYYLYRMTRDNFYLDVGERVLQDLTARSKVTCGLTGILDLYNNTRDDRMESFVLSETLKYLVLLFDEDSPIHTEPSNYIFTTEGHLLPVNRTQERPMSKARRLVRGVEHLECPAYDAPTALSGGVVVSSLMAGIHARPDYEWARHLTNNVLSLKERKALEASDSPYWHADGRCEIPDAGLYAYDFVLSSTKQSAPEDFRPGPEKMQRTPDGYILSNITGIRAHVASRLDGKGYDVVKLGPNSVRTGQKVYITDSTVLDSNWNQQASALGLGDLLIQFKLKDCSSPFDDAWTPEMASRSLPVVAYPALFGASLEEILNPAKNHEADYPSQQTEQNVIRLQSNRFGCNPYAEGIITPGAAVMVDRGECTFIQKFRLASMAGASIVIVVSDDDTSLNPSADADEIVDQLGRAALVILPKSSGLLLAAVVNVAEHRDCNVVLISSQWTAAPGSQLELTKFASGPASAVTAASAQEATKRSLWLGGRPIKNVIVVA